MLPRRRATPAAGVSFKAAFGLLGWRAVRGRGAGGRLGFRQRLLILLPLQRHFLAFFRGQFLDFLVFGAGGPALLRRQLGPRGHLLLQALRWGPAEREEIEHREKVEHIIDFLEIQAFRKTPVGQLPYGLQKRVDLGRALAMEPQVLLLDEPMAGMNLEEKQDMCRFILDVNDEFGTTIVLIEHDMGVVMDISDRVVVLDYGKKIGDGAPAEVRNNEDVIRAYLGTSH